MFKMISRVFFCILLCICSIVFAEGSNHLYNSVSGKVVYIRHELFLDATSLKDTQKVELLSRELRLSLIDSYFPVSTGSGFFVDGKGRVMTNRHVAETPAVQVLRQSARKILFDAVESKKSKFSASDRTQLLKDLDSIISNSTYRMAAMIGDTVLGELSLLAINSDVNDPDLALLEIKGFHSQPLQLYTSDDFGGKISGMEVYSFGYPLGSFFDINSKDRVATMNKGIVSAFRKSDLLDVQHSAAISSGNSGGPLVDSKGRVVGINTAGMDSRVGNSLFYAVSMSKISDFLKKKGFEDILTWNSRTGDIEVQQNNGLKQNEFDELESAKNLIIHTPAGVDITVNDVMLGSGKQTVQLEKSLNTVVCSGSGVYATFMIRRNKDSGESQFTPFSLKKYSTLSIISEPTGGTVFADARKIGVTPFQTYLLAGEYTFTASKDSSFFSAVTKEIDFQSAETVKMVGEPGRGVLFSGIQAPEDIIVSIKNNQFQFSGNISDSFYIPSSEVSCTLYIRKDDVTLCEETAITIPANTTTMDIRQYLKESTLTIRGFQEGTSVYIDGKLLNTQAGEQIALPVDVHSITLFKPGFMIQSYPRVTVYPDNSNFVIFKKKAGYDKLAKQSLITSIVLGTVGISGSVFSLYTLQNGYLMSKTDSYSEYEKKKQTGYLTSGISLGVSVSSLIAALISVSHYKSYTKSLEALDAE